MPRLFVTLVAALAGGDLLLGAVSLRYLPAAIPVHWNWQGEVDRYGSPWEVGLALPAVVLVLGAVLVAASRLPLAASKSAAGDQAQYRRAFGMFSVATLASLAAVHIAMILFALGWPVRVDRAALFVVGALMLWVSFAVADIPRNPIIGIRTPWTLASDDVWRQTHLFAGRLFVAYGLAILLAALVAPAWVGFAVVGGGAIGLVFWSLVFSRQIYRRTL